MSFNIEQEFLSSAIKRLKYYKSLGEKAIEQLEPGDFNFSPGEESNSIAVIVQHLHGNMMSRWTNFLTEDGEKTWRKRDQEFEDIQASRDIILQLWKEGWHCFLSTLEKLEPEDLSKTVYIRQEPLSVVDAINRQLAHYPYHIGQILYLARMIRKENWRNLSIPKGESLQYNQNPGTRDPAKNFQ